MKKKQKQIKRKSHPMDIVFDKFRIASKCLKTLRYVRGALK